MLNEFDELEAVEYDADWRLRTEDKPRRHQAIAIRNRRDLIEKYRERLTNGEPLFDDERPPTEIDPS